MKHIAIINQQSSFNTPDGREALDLALIFAAIDQQVSVIFIGDGVYQLHPEQNPERIKSKDYLSTMKAFDLYDVEQVLVCEQSLEARGIDKNNLNINAQLQTSTQISDHLKRCDHVLTL